MTSLFRNVRWDSLTGVIEGGGVIDLDARCKNKWSHASGAADPVARRSRPLEQTDRFETRSVGGHGKSAHAYDCAETWDQAQVSFAAIRSDVSSSPTKEM